MNEPTLVKKCLKRDQRAQKELFDKYSPKMMGVCLRYMKNKEQAEDALQDGFVKVFSKLNLYKGKGSLEGWVRRVLVNTCLDQIRKKVKLNMNVSMDEVEYMIEHNGYIIEGLSAKDLLEMVNSMPDGYRVVFNMFAIEGYSHKEIAKELGVSENTSKSQYLRARGYLRIKMEEQGIER